MEAMDIQAVESKLSDVTVTAIPMSGKNVHKDLGHGGSSHATISTVPAASPSSIGKDKDNGTSKYAQLLAVIEEMDEFTQNESPRDEIAVRNSSVCEDVPTLTHCGPHVGLPPPSIIYGFRPKMASWSTKWRWNTGYSADSVEWCPVEPYRDVLVCGTYQLEKEDEDQQTKKQTRLGRIYLFQINQDTVDLCPVQSVDTAGILDQKWCYHTIQDHPVLAVVTSEGSLQLYQLYENDGYNLKLWLEDSIGQDVLALSLDWSTNKESGEPLIVVSGSAGDVTVFKIVGSGLMRVRTWKSHGFEAWIAAFNYWSPDVLYSGGDDCVFKSYDIRVPDAAVMTNRSHEAGVTSIRSQLDVEHQLITGSYDEKVRLWDTRSLKRCLTETAVNGGVWRLKYHPSSPTNVLAACMYGGFRVLGVTDSISVLCEYMEHESIAYGADWKFDKSRTVATCSFYDCSMHVGKVDIEN